jgi:hypothetical protein
MPRMPLVAIAGVIWVLPMTVDSQAPAVEPPNNSHARHVNSRALDPAANDQAIEAFLREVRRGTARYAHPRDALRAGYRRIGGRFPAMGEHWVHTGVIMRGRFDPADPAILAYADIVGRPSLVGVAFAIPLAPGETPPLVAGASREWHEHNGSVADESVFAKHEHAMTAVASTRLAILHVWSELPNPAGTFATDNWALPFASVGLRVPAPISESAARALSLASGAADYYVTLLDLRDNERVFVSARLKEVEQRVLPIVAAVRSAGESRPEDLGTLEAIWAGTVSSLAERLGDRVAPLRPAAAAPAP